MHIDYGKKFETKFEEDFSKIPNTYVFRLKDNVSGFKLTSRNPADFFCYHYPYMFCIECKSRKGNTFSLTNFTQLQEMQEIPYLKGLLCGVVIWFRDHNKVCFCDIQGINQLIENGYKSINVNMIDDNVHNVYSIPGKLKRVFIDSDYNKLIELAKNKFGEIKNEI